MSVKIFRGIESSQHMNSVFGQGDLAGIKRLSFTNKYDIRGISFHIASHVIDETYVHQKNWHYSEAHKHDFDEINILIAGNSLLKYKIELDGSEEEVSAPSLIYIPAGIMHRAEPICGTGTFLCVYLDAEPGAELSKE
jgi:mannose-6-phosphate isomerase-like protein (cupin superfamily)